MFQNKSPSFLPLSLLGYFGIVVMTMAIYYYPSWIIWNVIVSPGGENIVSVMFTEGYMGFPYLLGLFGIAVTSVFFISKIMYRKNALNLRLHIVLSLISLSVVVAFGITKFDF